MVREESPRELEVEPAPVVGPGNRGLLAALAALVFVPAVALFVGFDDGEVVFVLYREAKHAAVGVLGWTFLAAVLWVKRRQLTLPVLWGVTRRPAVLALFCFVLYSTISLGWSLVPANGIYELRQWFLLLPLLIILVGWAEISPPVLVVLRVALCLSMVVVVAIGVAQLAGGVRWLLPINPLNQLQHASLMGYKNPAALAVLGQIFVLAGMVLAPAAGGGSRALRWAGGCLLVVELVYLGTLLSRTSLVALGAGLLFLGAAWLGLRPSRRSLVRVGVPFVLVIVVIAAAVASFPPTRERAHTVVDLLRDPAGYLSTDRGTYLLNTLQMLRSNPFGVGAGNWQTQYPVYRKYNREVYFSLSYQARRAHSDHLQNLGEVGYPGELMWLAFCLLVVAAPLRAGWRLRDPWRLFLAAQVAALTVAMAFDYLIEMPYHRFMVVMVAVLALSSSRGSCVQAREHTPPRVFPRWVPVVVALAAAVNVMASLNLARGAVVAARLQAAYLEVVGESARITSDLGEAPPGADRARVTRAAALARSLLSFRALTKTSYRDDLVAAHACALAGDRPAALVLLRRSLNLHPYNPNAMLLAASLAEDVELAEQWRRAADHVLNEATSGFDLDYPRMPAAKLPRRDSASVVGPVRGSGFVNTIGAGGGTVI